MSGADSVPTVQARSRLTRRRWITAVVLTAVMAGGIWLVRGVRRGFREMYVMEARLHAMYFVLGQVCEYVDVHKAWPRSWSNLPTKLRDPIGAARSEWESSWPPLPDLIAIDFDATLEQVAAQTPETFTAVKFTPGGFYNHAYPIQEVIDAAQRAKAQNGK